MGVDAQTQYFLQVAAGVTTCAVIWGAGQIHKMSNTMTGMKVLLENVIEDMEEVKNSYVKQESFDELRVAFWKVHDEHISCKVCK